MINTQEYSKGRAIKCGSPLGIKAEYYRDMDMQAVKFQMITYSACAKLQYRIMLYVPLKNKTFDMATMFNG